MSKVIIKAGKGKLNLGLKDLLSYRDLFWLLVYRDYRVRYAQTFLGLTWAFIQPFATLLIFTLVFSYAIEVDTQGLPYPLFAMVGLTAWSFFAFVLSNSGNSVVGAQDMIKKIYFPRLVIPFSKAVVGFIDYGISFLFVIILCIYYGFKPSPNILYLPILIVMTVITSLAIGVWMSALTIRFRDFQHIIPFLVQLGLYATPVAYPSELVVKNIPSWASFLFYANPMAGIVEGYRWCILGIGSFNSMSFVSYSVVIVVFVTGLFYFRSMEKKMADII